jgi:sigma-B regulation protein RsbU (phosphoserine phosphatase)
MDIAAIASEYVRILIILFQMTCVSAVIAYLVTRTRQFSDVINHKAGWGSRLIIILIFGAFSIYGTVSNMVILGAPVNIRDLGPMVAGLIGGPVIGLGAGVIGAAYRMTLGGFSAVPCSIATMLSGLLGGLVFLGYRKQFIGIRGAAVFAAGMESIHMGLVLILARPYEDAVNLVSLVGIPMILANTVGIFIFAVIISNLITEKKTMVERDLYHAELERHNAELAIAREIQVSFLPEHIPPVPGFDLAVRSLPAKEVGGDFYDAIIPISKHRIGLLIADVSGKGVPAALFMALSRTITRANAAWHSRASDAIRNANTMIAADAKYGMFVTLFFSIINTETKEVSYVNAGHNPPLILHGDLKREVLAVTGPALGIMPDADYREEVVTLRSGDIVVCYTDGVVEAFDTHDEEFGLERFWQVIERSKGLPAESILDAIVREVGLFSAGAPQSDDLTLMVLKVADEGQ